MRVQGYPAFTHQPGRMVRRSRAKILRRRACRYVLLSTRWALLLDWVPGEGLWASVLFSDRSLENRLATNERPMKVQSMKKRQALGLEDIPLPPLSLESKFFDKLPRLREFLIVTAYDDGSVRVPGSFRMENKIIAVMVTLYDPDAGLRLAVSGATIDDALKTADTLLGAPDAPWEVDRYLTEQLLKKKKNTAGKSKSKK